VDPPALSRPWACQGDKLRQAWYPSLKYDFDFTFSFSASNKDMQADNMHTSAA